MPFQAIAQNPPCAQRPQASPERVRSPVRHVAIASLHEYLVNLVGDAIGTRTCNGNCSCPAKRHMASQGVNEQSPEDKVLAKMRHRAHRVARSAQHAVDNGVQLGFQLAEKTSGKLSCAPSAHEEDERSHEHYKHPSQCDALFRYVAALNLQKDS